MRRRPRTFPPWVRLLLVLVALLLPPAAAARTWYAIRPPQPEVKNALCTLIEGDDTWVGYEGFGLVLYNYYGEPQLILTPKEGLPGPTVTDLVRRDKELWIGTADGLVSRHEGGAMRVFTTDLGLPDNGITSLAVHGSTLYAGTMKGLAVFRGGGFTVIGEEQGLPSAHVTDLCSCEKGLLVATTKGWAVVRGDAVEAHSSATDPLPCEWITAIAYYRYQNFKMGSTSTSSDEWIVLGTAGEGMYRYNSGAYKGPEGGELVGPGLPWVTCLVYEPVERKLWVGGKNGLAVEDVVANSWERFDMQNSELPSDEINDISLRVIDDPIYDYELLNASGLPQIRGQACPCATCARELASPHPKPCKTCWEAALPRKPKIHHKIQTWAGIGTPLGACVYYHKNMPHVGQSNFYAYLANQGYKTVGMGKGEYIFAGVYPPGAAEGFLFVFAQTAVRFQPFGCNPPTAQYTTEINTLTTDHRGNPMVGGRSVIGGGVGILDYQKDIWEILAGAKGLTDTNVTTFWRDGPEVLVGTGGMGNSGSIFRLKDGSFTKFSTAGLPVEGSTSLFPSPVTAICADEKKVYVGTKKSGVYTFEDDGWTRMESLHTKALSTDEIQALACRNGVLYVGTKRGIDAFCDGATSHVDITSLSAQTNEVEALLWDDSEGDTDKLVLWVGHKDGILRISMAQGVMVHGGKCRARAQGGFLWPSIPPMGVPVFGWSWVGNPREGMVDVCPFDGLPGNHVTCLLNDDLNLWIGTENGLCRIRK